MALFAEFFGGTPKVPKFVPVSAQEEQTKAITGNAASLPALKELGADVNAFNTDQLQMMLRKMIPDYDKLVAGQSSNIASWLKGEIPSDVSGAVQRNAAVRSLYGGYGGSGMSRNLVARDLGLTSLDLTQRGLDSATRWTAATAQALQPGMFNVQSMFIRPEFQAAFAQEERNAKFQRDYVKNQWDWYGSFGQQAVRFEDSVVQLAGTIGAAAACYVAREVFGETNPKWKLFRHWLFTYAPTWFKNLYIENGERFAKWISNKPKLKNIIRKWMEKKIESI